MSKGEPVWPYDDMARSEVVEMDLPSEGMMNKARGAALDINIMGGKRFAIRRVKRLPAGRWLLVVQRTQ